MNSKKLVSLIVLVAAIFLIVIITENLGDKKYQRNEYKPIVIATEPLDSRDDLEDELALAQTDVSWQTSRLAILQDKPNLERIRAKETKVEQSKSALKKTLGDAYEVAKSAIQKNDIPFFRTEEEVVAKKKAIDKLLSIWKDSINKGNPPTVTEVNSYLNTIQTYLIELENLIKNLTPENSGLAQGQIDTYEKNIENSIAEVKNTITILTEIQSDVKTAEEDLLIEKNVGNTDAIQKQIEKVVEAQAVVVDIKDKLDNLPIETQGDTSGTVKDISTETIVPVTTTVPVNKLNPNIIDAPPFDPSKPHLKQD